METDVALFYKMMPKLGFDYRHHKSCKKIEFGKQVQPYLKNNLTLKWETNQIFTASFSEIFRAENKLLLVCSKSSSKQISE